MKNTRTYLTALAVSAALVSLSNAQTPHPEDAGKNTEHLAMLAIVPESSATSVVANSGNWSNPSTWNGGTLPASGARILIPAGKSLTVDNVLTARIKWIRVNGTLNFSPLVNTELKVETIIVDPSGFLNVGTATEPIKPNVSARIVYIDDGDIDRSWDKLALSRGLISHGTARIFGSKTTPYAALAQSARKGATSLELQTAPVGWKTGGRIVLPSVIQLLNRQTASIVSDNEEFTITAITGTSVTLNRPLSFDHVPPFNLPVVLAYLDRNVTFISENFATKRRGHNMFMHSANVQIADALFEQCGRTDAKTEVTDPKFDSAGNLIPTVDSKGNVIPVANANDRGRYALHFHRTIPNSSRVVTVQRVCIVNSPKLGFVNHDSNVVCEDSVVYDAAGAAFFTEVGSEIGAFQRCVAIHTVRGTGRLEERGTGGDSLVEGTDFSHEGNGFWLQGGGVAITDSMAFESRAAGFSIVTTALHTGTGWTRFDPNNLENPAWAGGAPYYEVGQVPLKMFRNNLSINSEIGLTLRKHDPSLRPSLIEDSKFVNCSYLGIFAEYGGNKVLQNCLIHGGSGAVPGQTPWAGGRGNVGFKDDNVNVSPTLDNVTIENFRVGISTAAGGTVIVRNSQIDAIVGIHASFGVEVSNTSFLNTVPLVSPNEDPNYSYYRHLDLERLAVGAYSVKVDGIAYALPQLVGEVIAYNVPPATVPVRINSQPVSRVAPSGSAVTFSTSAVGNGSLSYQWYHNDAPLAGATNPSLAIPNFGISQVGVYSARVSSSAGAAETQYALLSLGAAGPAAPALTAAASRKQHGVFGTFDLPLPLSGTPAVEPRLSGDTLALVLTFSAPISAATPVVTAGDGTVTSTSLTGNQVVVSLSGVSQRKTLTLAVNNVTGTNGGMLASASVTLAVLPSDANADKMVNASDILLTKAGTAAGTVNANNFKLDTNLDGLVNASDINLSKFRSGTLVP